MSSNDFILKHKLKNEATSNIEIYQILSSLSLSDVGIYLRGGPFESDIGIVNVHPIQATDWLLYFHECYFDSYGITPPNKLSEIIIKRNGHCFFPKKNTSCDKSKRFLLCRLLFIYNLLDKSLRNRF